MSDDGVKCENCGTMLVDLERRLEWDDRAHRHHPSDCVRALRTELDEAHAVLGNILSLGVLNLVQHGITKPRAEALFARLSELL